MSDRPLVLCLSGHDPTGGAGIQADIEACAANGAHALSVITALTVQDTRDVRSVTAVDPALLRRQLEALLADCNISAVKIGLLGSAAQIPLLAQILRGLQVPVVLDPVLRAGGGANLADDPLQTAMLEQLLPLITVLTPNAAEARRLAPQAGTLDQCAQALLARGCSHVLITGGDEPGERVINRHYRSGAAAQLYEWPRLAGGFHGAGCTLAAALAARLAGAEDLVTALHKAQAWTHGALTQARAIGHGRRIPGRLP